MKTVSFAMFCGLLVVLVTEVAIFPQANGRTETPAEELVVALRTLNTTEYSYREENGRFANREEMLAFLRKEKCVSSKGAIDLENPKPYERGA